MDRIGYVKITQTMLPYASDKTPLIWVFQQDNYRNHTSEIAKGFAINAIRVIEWAILIVGTSGNL